MAAEANGRKNFSGMADGNHGATAPDAAIKQAEAATNGTPSSGSSGSPLDKLKELLKSAQEGLEQARAYSEQLENNAQQVAEKAIALRDEAAEAESEADAAMAKVEEVLADETTAEENVMLAQEAYNFADENLKTAQAALEALPPSGADIAYSKESSNYRAAKSLDEDSGLEAALEMTEPLDAGGAAAAKQAVELAAEELSIQAENLAFAKEELQNVRSFKLDLQKEAMELSEAAKSAQERASAADEHVAQAMALAEKAVAREVEASQRVSDSEIAIKKAEKLAEDVAQAVAALAEAEKAERQSLETAEAAAQQAVDAQQEIGGMAKTKELPQKDNGKPGSALSLEEEEALKPVSFPQVAAEALSKVVKEEIKQPLEQPTGDSGPSNTLQEGDDEKTNGALDAKAKKAEAPKEPAPAGQKSSTKRSSRYMSSSYFSVDDGGEFSPTVEPPAIISAIRKNLPKILLTITFILAGSTAFNSKYIRRRFMQPQEIGTEVQTNMRPVIAEFKKLPNRVQRLLNKLPKQEVNEEEAQLFDVLWLLLASVIFVPLFQKLPGGSPVLGYLAAGVLIGPYTLSIIKHVHGTKALAEFGVVFLMFNIGLELSLERLRSMRKYVFGLGSAQTFITAAVIGCIANFLCGVSGPASIVIGNGLALSSTAVVLQVLQERGESTSRHGRATFSVLLFQDLAVVVLLILIPLISPSSSKGGVGFNAIAEALGIAAVKAVVAIAGIIAGGRLLLRPVYKQMAENHNAEIFAANTLLVVLGTSVLTARAGLSMALGAFLAGLLLAETEFALQVEADINAYRGLLLGLFFMTVGMSIDPQLLVAKFSVILTSIALLIVGKTMLVASMGRAFGMGPIAAVRAGLLLAPGGEFAFVAFGEAVNQGIMNTQLSSLLFLIVGISMAITPWLAAGGQALASRFEQQDVRSLLPVETETDDLQGHIIICGFGRIGQIIAQLLSERLIPFVALDVRTDRVTAGRALDLPVYFGDAGSKDVLHKVGAARAAAAVITLDTPGANYRTVWALSKNFPNVKTFVRAHDVDHGINLEKAGATAVVPETLEPSLQLAAAVLAQAKLPAAEIAATIDDFRTRHLSELAELSSASGTSLGYGFSKILAKPKPLVEGMLGKTTKIEDNGSASDRKPEGGVPAVPAFSS
eukprot:SM000019S05109  [mRNA]  locus=s19:978602:987779:+ [translate_table: standard]